jgi:hypothetical protein
MTTASLGFKIDSTQASSAAVDLDKLYAAASKMETAADSLTASAGALAGALKKVGEETKKVPPVAKPFENQDEHVKAFRAEIERLTVKYQPLAQAQKNYAATVADINRAHQMGIINAQQMTKRLDEERLAFERLKTSAMGASQAVIAANQNGGGSRAFNTSNLAAQGFDIGSTAAFMPWYTVALQQGPQVAQVFNDIKASGQSIGPAVAGAFMQILNPISLVTIGVIGGVAALVQYFTTAESGGEKTARLFEEQNEVIRRAADLWGDAAPALKAYVDELDRADKITQGREAGVILAGRELEGLAERLDGIKRKGIEAFRSLQGDPNNAVVVRDLREAWGELRERLDAGTASMADLNRVQQALAGAVGKYGTPQVLAFSKAFDEVTAAIYRGVEAAQKARTEWIAAIAGATNVQDIVGSSTFNDNGTIRRPADFIPRVPGVPVRRPSDLAGDPDVVDPRIMNSDGRLVGVPVPGQKPNFFELEKENEKLDEVTRAYRRAQEAKADFWLDLSYAERQAGRSAMDQQIANTLTRYGFNEDLNSPEANALRSQLRQNETKDVFKGFFSGMYAEAWSNGGKIGKAILTSALNAFEKAGEKAWDRVADIAASWLTDLVTGNKSSPAGAVAASFAPTTTLGALLGADSPANDNVSLGGMGAYRSAISAIESGGRYDALGPVTRNGDRAYGKYQMMGNNIGPWSKDALGRSISASEFLANPSLQDQIFDHRFGGYVDKYGASGAAQAWFGGPGSVGKGGIATDILGTSGNDYVAKFNSQLEKATTNLGGFGNGLGQLGSALTSGGSSGGSSWLSFLTGSIFSGSGQLRKTGGVGLFANGTSYAPGGMAIVGERGPELLNLPQGSAVTSNHKLMSALAANQNGGGIAGIRLFVDQDGNWQAKVESIAKKQSETTSRQALGSFKQSQQRAGFGNDQKTYNSRKG